MKLLCSRSDIGYTNFEQCALLLLGATTILSYSALGWWEAVGTKFFLLNLQKVRQQACGVRDTAGHFGFGVFSKIISQRVLWSPHYYSLYQAIDTAAKLVSLINLASSKRAFVADSQATIKGVESAANRFLFMSSEN